MIENLESDFLYNAGATHINNSELKVTLKGVKGMGRNSSMVLNL
jgi:hypothetical protein